jgi:hypothetical protein
MTRTNTTYDVFISHSAVDKELAAEIASACKANGLKAFTGVEIASGVSIADALWEALAESRAVIAILSRSELTPSMAIELGGARAWNKPIFGILTDPTRQMPLVGFSNIHLYTAARIADVIRQIQLTGEGLSASDRESLASVYAEFDISIDQLAVEPKQLETLAKRFSRATGKIVPGERLLSELLRMRKQGKLARSGRGSKHRTGTD